MKYLFVALFSILGICSSQAQVKLFSELPGNVAGVKEATLLKLNQSSLNSVLDKAPEELILDIPFQGRNIRVNLEKTNPFDGTFRLETSQNKQVAYTPGVYYSGKHASFNFFEGELNGIVSLPGVGNLVIGPYLDNYIVYNDASLSVLNQFECAFEDPSPEEIQRTQPSTQRSTVAKCVTVYLEVDYQLHVNKGSNVTTTTNFVTSMFNHVKTLFANAGVTLSLKNMYIWTTQDPYSGTTSSAQLQLFHQNRPSFDANVGQLLAMDSGLKGGIADAVMGVCSANKYSYVDVDPGFNNVPTYSWSVQGMTHEFGHLLGSPHTHACAWNGNNTPIDGCGQTAGYREGSCSTGPTPTGGGTIMSYCHLVSGVGINFANGFGTQPTQRLLSTISGATCIAANCTTPAAACTNGVGTLTLSTQTSTSLGFSWTDTSATTSWQVGVFTMAGSGTYSTVTTKSFTKTGLTANTFYKIRIRPVCASGETIAYKEFIVATNPTTWCAATISDSGGSSGAYSANENYIRTIVPTSGTKAKLTFSQFNLEANKDYLYVYNGSGTTTLLGTFTGTTLPAAITSTASNGALTLKFVSNASTQTAGFVAKVDCIAPVVVCTNGIGSITLTSQTSTSLGFSWTDTSATTSWQVGVFTMAGSGTYSTVTTKSFTKTGLTANTFYKIRIRPVCSSGEVIAYKEFIVATNPTTWCAATITDSGGSSGAYSANENYTRTIVPTAGTKAKLTFSQFNLEANNDYLYVYNGSGTTTLLGTFTGTTLPAAITSTASDGALTLKFVSNASTQPAGFVVKVDCITPATTTVPTTCTASTTWNGSAWSNGVPSETKSAIIDGNYTAGTTFTCCNLIINSGKTLTVQANKYIVVKNNITNNGNLVVQHNGQLFQINDSGVNTGNGKFSRTCTNLAANAYVYWSSPTSNTTLATGLYGWYNHSIFKTENFIDLKTINAQGVVTANVPDGLDDDSNAWVAQSESTVMVKGKGYIARNPTTGTKTKDFVGVPNNGVIEIALANSPNSANRNYNLVGNPYPSAISAKDVINANTGTTGVLYFWTHKQTPVGTTPGGVPGDYAGISDFSAYSLTGGITSESGSPAPNGTIPTHQAFFVDRTTATKFVFNNSMRKTSLLNTNFLREQQSERYWLSLRNEGGFYRQILIGYDVEASIEEDWGYDAKLPLLRAGGEFYSLIGDDAYAIQSRGAFNDTDEVPLGFKASSTGEFRIEIDETEGGIDRIYVKDSYTGITHDLQEPYVFTTEAGEFNDRFSVVYERLLSTDDSQFSEVRVYPNPTKDVLYVSVPYESFEIFDTSGRLVGQGQSEIISIGALPSGMYLLRIDKKETFKVVKQ